MYLSNVEIMIRARLKELSAQKKLNNMRIFLFGHNAYTEYINNCLYEEGYRLSGIIDNDEEKQGTKSCNVQISAPKSINWGYDSVVLIASKHEKCMMEQMQQLSKKVKVFRLLDFNQMKEKIEKRSKFWLEENYKTEFEKLQEGAAVYDRLKQSGEVLAVFPIPSLGDIFVAGLCYREFEKKLEPRRIRFVIASQGTYKVTQLYEIETITVISKKEIDALVKYIFYCVTENEAVVCSWGRIFWRMARYKKIMFPNYNAKYFFKLGNKYQMNFPSIWDEKLREEELLDRGIFENKTVVLAPYANTIEELPIQFWEILAHKLSDMKYHVLTNTTGGQKPVRGTREIDIPLHQIGNYLDFAGYFISLRSGLCDVAGRSRCKQIIIFRDKAEIEFFDLHAENVSKNAVQFLYDDKDLFKNIEMVINYMKPQIGEC